jgi:hypothetical protein
MLVVKIVCCVVMVGILVGVVGGLFKLASFVDKKY